MAVPLIGLFSELVAMPTPKSGVNWLWKNPPVRQYLRGLARRTIPLTHEGLGRLPSWRVAEHLRDLLMLLAALPPMDRLLHYQRWAGAHLETVKDAEHERLLRRYMTWHELPRLRRAAARAPLSSGARNYAAANLRGGHRFLVRLARQKPAGRQLHELTQADLDR